MGKNPSGHERKVMIHVYAYRTWQGERRVTIETVPHRPLTTEEAAVLRDKLTAAIEARLECIDCGSDLHTVDDPSCHVSNAAERACED